MKVIAYTNKGSLRRHNEDALYFSGILIIGSSMNIPVEFAPDTPIGCCTVIDGMGGYKGGEEAARFIATSFLDGQYEWNISTDNAEDKLRGIIDYASKRIASFAVERPELASMGAALAGIAVCNDAVIIFNAGDCRVYRLHEQYLEKLSHDHSYVQELYDRGEIEEDEMRTHPRKNVIYSSVCADPESISIYFRKINYVKNGINFFVCSDGVWEALSVDEIEDCFAGRDYYEGAYILAERLQALGEECKDNISFLIVEVESWQ